MSAQDDFTRVFLWVLGLLVLFTIVVLLIARSIGMDENSGPMTDHDIDERTRPYGGVTVADVKPIIVTTAKQDTGATAVVSEPAKSAQPAAPAPAPKPQAAVPAAIDARPLYQAGCAACHDSGVAGAPRLGDKGAWATRIDQGIDRMVETAIRGKGGMPPKGGRPDYSDAQIRAIVEYMATRSR